MNRNPIVNDSLIYIILKIFFYIVAFGAPFSPTTPLGIKREVKLSLSKSNKSKLNQLHAISRTQQCRQREPCVKTHRSPLSTEFWRYERVEWRNSTSHFALTPERRNENINVGKYFNPSSGDRTHNQSILQSHYVILRLNWKFK